MEKYRFDQYGSVYKLNGDHYIFIGKLNGRTEAEFISEYEQRDLFDGGEDE
jgi:hypothetical protein